ncbi:helix-turn-helix domain-containing protein [Glaciecola sp. SC05]|uniref:helix-turn-helix domain-containing protein n=1 Tax=Glaciecola sp. SC05 TaxID=1987355 RepID=UPI0035289A34
MKSFSSGEIASICDVTPRTVIRWIGAGRLNAFKLPGRGNNRVNETDLFAFLTQNNMPIPADLAPVVEKACVIVTEDEYLSKHVKRIVRDANFVVSAFENGIEAGFEIALKKPLLVVLDADLECANPCHLRDHIKRSMDYAPEFIIFASDTQAARVAMTDASMSVLAKPFSLNEFAQTLEHKMHYLS